MKSLFKKIPPVVHLHLRINKASQVVQSCPGKKKTQLTYSPHSFLSPQYPKGSHSEGRDV